MTKETVRSMLKLYRSAMTKAQRRRTRNRKPRGSSYPIAAERQYARFITNKASTLVSYSLNALRPLLDNWDQYAAKNNVKLDAASGDIEAIFASLQEEMLLLYGTTYLASDMGRTFAKILEAVFGKNSKFLQEELRIVSGVAFSTDAPWWNDMKALWEQENYKLITSLSEEYVTKLNSIIINGIQKGATLEELALEIQKLSDNITGPRSRLIARDQIGKLNSMIARNQYTDIGMETYYWRTAQDEKVRGNPRGRYAKAVPSHFIMEGKLFSLQNSSVYYNDETKKWEPKTALMEFNHPGMAIMCRCIPIPSWNTYLTQIDEELPL